MTAESFPRNMLISIGGHLLIVVIVFVRAFWGPSEPIDFRNAIRVDIVGLPQKTQELPEVPAEKPTVAPPAAPKAPDLPQKAEAKPEKTHAPEVPNSKAKQKAADKAQKRAMEKLKAMDALDKLKQEVAKEKSHAKNTAVQGNVQNSGNALSGLDRIEFDRYFDELQTKVRDSWNIPQWLADQDLKAEVLVIIDDRGYVIKKVFQKTSGNSVFDAKVIEAIETSSPWPPPPQRLRGRLSSSGIVFKFPQ